MNKLPAIQLTQEEYTQLINARSKCDKRKEYLKKYHKSDKGKAARRNATNKYRRKIAAQKKV